MVIEVRTAIKYEITWRRVERKRLPQLLNHPRTRRMPGRVEVENLRRLCAITKKP
jgi:hypothetical protein